MAENEICFSQPHWLVIAKGMDTEKWFEQGEGIGTGGITRPEPVHLSVGHRYYRFASSTTPKSAQLGGGWWISYESFKIIERFASDNQIGGGITYAARLFLALPYEWTRVDRLVTAILEVPLKAYTGYGNVAQGSRSNPETKWTPTQSTKVAQLYIPGLYTPSRPNGSHLYQRAFPDPTLEYISSNRRKV